MKTKMTLALALIAGVLASPVCFAQEKLLVQMPAAFDDQGNVWGNIRSECAVDTMISNYVFERVSLNFSEAATIQDISKAGSTKVLALTILGATGAGGGVYSGAKSMTVRADLMENGKILRSVVKKDSSRGNVLSGGTCGILERVAKTIAKDMVTWLKQPPAAPQAGGNVEAVPAASLPGTPATAPVQAPK
jgi:hypothetical protein